MSLNESDTDVKGGKLAMPQPTPSIPFPWAWWGLDLGEARPCDGTYCQYPYEHLPPIQTLDGTLR
jgi:hypothetical protein